MKNFRLIYSKLDKQRTEEIIFNTIIQAKSMRGAKIKAKNLQPFQWDSMRLRSLEFESNLALDKLEFNYWNDEKSTESNRINHLYYFGI